MKTIAVVIGSLLILTGLAGYLYPAPVPADADGPAVGENAELPAGETVEKPKKSLTALIPAAFGLPILLAGLWAHRRPAATMHAMHAAVSFALLGGVAALIRVVPATASAFSGDEVNGLALASQWIMAVLCLVFVVLCVNSFIAARKARQSEKSAT